jgi:hypothetical protein
MLQDICDSEQLGPLKCRKKGATSIPLNQVLEEEM